MTAKAGTIGKPKKFGTVNDAMEILCEASVNTSDYTCRVDSISGKSTFFTAKDIRISQDTISPLRNGAVRVGFTTGKKPDVLVPLLRSTCKIKRGESLLR